MKFNRADLEPQRQAAIAYWRRFMMDESLSVPDELTAEMDRVAAGCESPIEVVFAYYWCAVAHRMKALWPSEPLLTLQTQESFDNREHGTYRFDFTVHSAKHGQLLVAIECDGHDWHERTPEQVAQRNSRDRWMQFHQWIILHYSGREIMRDPTGCAAPAWLVAFQKAARMDVQ